jgi:magnesium chelatase accessory protein
MPFERLPADWPHRGASVRIDCAPHRWHAQAFGDGPTTLLLHGAGGATHSFRALAPLLAQDGRAVAIDLPGQGFTHPGTLTRCGIDAMAQDVAALVAAQGWAPRVIVGHSAGGALALRLAELLPDPKPAVVGINAALSPFEGMAGWLFPLFARALALNPFAPSIFARMAGGEPGVRRLLAATGSTPDDEGVRLYARLIGDPKHVGGTLMMMAQWRLEELLERLPFIGAPTLLIAGGRDRAVPPEVSERAVARLPDARLAMLPSLGHLAHEEAPDRVAALIRAFQAEVAARP